MAANREDFPWLSYYGNYRFFEDRMNDHDKVDILEKENDYIYNIRRTFGDNLRVFICECYAFGVAEYHEATDNIGPIDVVIIDSAWCSYSPDAKLHCRGIGVGLFKIHEFMGALNIREYWTYLTKDQREFFRKQGWV